MNVNNETDPNKEQSRDGCGCPDMLQLWIEKEKDIKGKNPINKTGETGCALTREKRVAIKDDKMINTFEWLPEIPFENVCVTFAIKYYFVLT